MFPAWRNFFRLLCGPENFVRERKPQIAVYCLILWLIGIYPRRSLRKPFKTKGLDHNSVVQGLESHLRNLCFMIVNEESLQNVKKGQGDT